MILAGAAVVPAAPILVPGMTQALPPELEPVRDRVGRTLAGLPPHDLLLILAGASRPEDEGVYAGGAADLGGLSRPDLRVAVGSEPDEAGGVAAATGLAHRDGPWPVDAAVLALLSWPHAGRAGAGGAMAVALGFHDGERLGALMDDLGAALREGIRVAVVASGDLSAGLTEKAPRHLVAGAAEWDESACEAIAKGDAGALAGLGPGEAVRVASRGWPALVALLHALREAGLALGGVEYAAPRGVGYVVAATSAA